MLPRRINNNRSEAYRQQAQPTLSASTDATNTRRSPTKWNGDQLHRASWFYAKVKEAKNTFRFIQLVMYSTVPVLKSGTTAVYNDEHACDHAYEQNVGTWSAPCTRRRTSSSLSATAHTATMRPTDGPIPEAAAATATPAATTTSASAPSAAPPTTPAPSTSATPGDDTRRSNLKKLLGEDAFHRHTFIDILVDEIKQDKVSILVEDTTENEMKLILKEGLKEISWDEFTQVTGRYEEWNDTLDDDCYHRRPQARALLNARGRVSPIPLT